MSRNSKKSEACPDVRVGVNGNSLRLQFSARISKTYFNRQQFFKSVGRKDTPENRRWLTAVVYRIQADLDHPDNLFDPSLKKYFVPIGEANRRVILKDLWEKYCQWKLITTQIHQTTYRTRYKTYYNWLKPWLERPIDRDLTNEIIVNLMRAENHKQNLKKLFRCLKAMGEWAVRNEFLAKNYFLEMGEVDVKPVKKSIQLAELEEYKAFSLKERDTIINAFYSSSNAKERQAAKLIEFLFLTGCRLGEAFALKWNDILTEGIIFKESYSTETKITKPPKNYKIRLFKTKKYTKLLNLLEALRLETYSKKTNNYVFISPNGENYDRLQLDVLWRGKDHGNGRFSQGVITRLVEEGKVSEYLKPSSTRHTFISHQARANVDLKLLADSVGNSIDVIYKHYLSSDKNAYFEDI